MVYTDLTDELYRAQTGSIPAGVRLARARQGRVELTRVEITRAGLERPQGRYVTLETPSVAMLDERDEEVIELTAQELRALVPEHGPVLVLGVGNRRVTMDALGPRTVQKVLVTMGVQSLPMEGIRPVAAVAPGVSAATGVALPVLAAALTAAVRPAALLCVDSLCSAAPERLGRTIQLSDTGLCPARPDSPRHLDAHRLGIPVIAAGIPTMMDSDAGPGLVLTCRALDAVVGHGAALLGAAINRALQPRLTVAQLCWLAS